MPIINKSHLAVCSIYFMKWEEAGQDAALTYAR